MSKRNVLKFLCGVAAAACLGAPLLVATVQVVQYNVSGLLRWHDLPMDVFSFWSGSATGIGVLTPALLIAARRRPQLWPGRPALQDAPSPPSWPSSRIPQGPTGAPMGSVRE